MDLQERKLKAIEYLIKIQDEKVLHEIESTITSIKFDYCIENKAFTENELILRAKESNQNYKVGQIKSQDQIEFESEKW